MFTTGLQKELKQRENQGRINGPIEAEVYVLLAYLVQLWEQSREGGSGDGSFELPLMETEKSGGGGAGWTGSDKLAYRHSGLEMPLGFGSGAQ